MEIETHVSVNGIYTTRRIPIDAILNANQARDPTQRFLDVQHLPSGWRRKPNSALGFVSKTLIPSSLVKSIIPARISHRPANELIFVTENEIRIKTILPNGHLQDVGKKSDFTSRIIAAAVLGEQVLPAEYAPQVNDSSRSRPNSYLPLHILVLTLDSGHISFLVGDKVSSNGILDLQECIIPLPVRNLPGRYPGKHLAVDPRGRALAVAATAEEVLVYCLKDRAILEREMQGSPDPGLFRPASQELPIAVKGTILGLGFLEDEDQVILVIVTRDGDDTTIVTCFWDAAGIPDKINRSLRSYKLAKDYERFHFIIPLEHSPSYLLVAGYSIILVEDVLSGSPKLSSISRTDTGGDVPLHWASSKRLPVYTAWSRCIRSQKWKDKKQEALYLVQEDGTVHYLWLNSSMQSSRSVAGRFNCNVSTAFATFLIDTLAGPDLLIAGGDLCMGEILQIGCYDKSGVQRRLYPPFNVTALTPKALTQAPDREMAMGAAVFERLADWSPIFDLAVAAIGSRELGPKSQRPSLYVTSGRQPYGAVTELRYGSGADTIIEMDASGLLGMASATGLWALPTGNDQETIVFFSSPGHTAILYLSETLEAEPVNDIGDYADGATVLAVLVMDRHILHIMEHSIFVGVFGPTEPPPDPMAIIRFPDSKILCAAYTKRVIIVAVQEQDAAFLQVYALGERLGTEDIRLIAQPFRLDSDPTCLVLFENQQNDSLYAALGLRNGLIHLFAIDHTTGLHHRHAHYIMHSSLQPFQTFIAESIAVLSHPKRANDLLVCGLRDGRLYVAEVLVRDNETVLQTSTITQLGEGPLRLSQAGTRSSVAFATCGSDTFRVGFDPGFEGEGLSLSNVWFYNTQTHDQHQPAMSSFCALWSDADGNATLGGLDKSVLLIAQVWSELRVIPRRLPLDVEDLNDTSDNSVGTPIKIHYSSYLDAMVIGSVRYEWVPPTSPETRHAAWKGKRRSRGVLQIMPSAKVHGEEVAAESTVVDLDPGELVKSIAELTLDLGGTRWHFLLVGTSFQPKDDDPGGRVFFFESARTKDGGVRLETRKISDLDRPVTAIASYDKTKFVLCTDNKLSVYELTVVSGRFKWKQLCSTPLLSSGLHITAAPPLIYVSTASDSLQVFTLAKDDTADTSGVKLERSFSDSRARDAECHLLVSLPWGETGQQFRNPLGLHEEPVDECPDLVLVADRAGGIAGLLHPKARANQYAVPTVFEGKLLQSVTRLVQADIRPPWRRIEDLKASGVLVDNIIGSTTDGTVYSFTIVNEELWCVLKYLENLVKKVKWMHTDLPEGDLNTPSAIDPEREFLTPLRQRKGGSHINGDLLERLLAEDGLDLLIDAIELARVANSVKSDSEPKPDSSSTDSEPEQHTSSWEKYPSGNWEDVAQIFMAHVRKTTDKQIDSLEEAAEQAMHLLRRLLQPTL